jgi:hypothetical protein
MPKDTNAPTRFPHALKHLERAIAATQAGDLTALPVFLERFAAHAVEHLPDNTDYHTIEDVDDMPPHLYQQGQEVAGLEQARDMLEYGSLEVGRWMIVKKAKCDCHRTYVLMENKVPTDAGEDRLEELTRRFGLDLGRGWTWSSEKWTPHGIARYA